MRILFATTAGAGHFGPLIPFAKAAMSAKAEVMVAAPASFEAAVAGAGFPFLALGEPPVEEWGPIMGRVRGMTEEEGNRLVVGEIFGRLDAGRALPAMLAAVDEWRPDVVIRETSEFSSLVAAEARGLPHVHVAIGVLAGTARALPAAAPAIDDLRTSLGLAADPAMATHFRAPTWTFSPVSFEDPSDPGPEQVRRFRDPGARGAADGSAKGSLPTVYVTFGTVAPNMGFFPALYRAILEALADQPVQVVMTVGRSVDPAGLGTLPANAKVDRWIDQAEVLGQASLVVNHGGYGTVIGCLAAGIPQVILPLFADQPINAARVGTLGAGIALPGSGTPDPELALASVPAVAEAVMRVLGDSSFRGAAETVATEIRALPTVDQAIATLA
jgi:hypothetical protein